MKIGASFVVTRLDLMREHWQQHSVLGGAGRVGTNRAIGRDVDLGGRFLVVDWPSKSIVADSPLSCPAGFEHSRLTAGGLVIASMRRNELYLTDGRGRIVQVLTHRFFNDLHSVSATRAGILVTSSGLDAVLELSWEGNLLWQWFAFQHGYSRDQFGDERAVNLAGADHRKCDYPTLTQATHVNAAVEDPNDDRVVYASFFHQGCIVRIDKNSGACVVVYEGLKNCHGLRVVRTNGSYGYSIANTRGREVLLFDSGFREVHRMPFDSEWIADAFVTDRRTVLVADAGSSRIVECDWKGQELESFRFDRQWRIYQADVL